LTIAYPYPHKNLAVLKEVSDILNSEGILYIFNVTVSDCFYKKVFQGYEDSIVNLGHVDNKNCPKLYEQVDAMILPTLVECFSASYPEAMVMNRPILTSDYSFAKSICGEAAIYFDPFNPSDIAEKIRLLASDRNLYKGLVSAGSKRLGSFLSPTQRCEKYINLLSMMRDKK
ncbi:glycosyltransferase, partial [Vibrio vulnificus]|nr:glycosyltransferase [Vibrio vulnificus]